jgi:hypothetical protein
MTLTLTVTEAKQNLCASFAPGTYNLAEVLMCNDRPLQIVKGNRRNRRANHDRN